MRVTVVSNEMVKPETRNEQHPKFLELSVLDQVQYRYHWPPLLAFFGPPKGGECLTPILIRYD